MKIVRGSDKLVITLEATEAQMLAHVGSAYPRVPPAHLKLSHDPKRIPNNDAAQALLDEALAEQRAVTKEAFRKILRNPGSRKIPARGGLCITLTYPEANLFLQVFNEVRVGSWVRLGSPEELELTGPDAESEDCLLMEAAGYLQGCILEALNPQEG